MQFEGPGSIIKHGKPEPKLSLTVGNKNEKNVTKSPRKLIQYATSLKRH